MNMSLNSLQNLKPSIDAEYLKPWLMDSRYELNPDSNPMGSQKQKELHYSNKIIGKIVKNN